MEQIDLAKCLRCFCSIAHSVNYRLDSQHDNYYPGGEGHRHHTVARSILQKDSTLIGTQFSHLFSLVKLQARTWHCKTWQLQFWLNFRQSLVQFFRKCLAFLLQFSGDNWTSNGMSECSNACGRCSALSRVTTAAYASQACCVLSHCMIKLAAKSFYLCLCHWIQARYHLPTRLFSFVI